MIVITGASDGVGSELAKIYQDSGEKVVNISRRESKYADVNILQDLREGANIKEAAVTVCDIKDPIKAVVNCVGVFSDEQLGGITEDEIKRLMSTNVKAPILLISELLDRIKQDQSDILNVVSIVGTVPGGHAPVYSTSKWAERGFTLGLQELLKDTPSRVISFCPAGIKTGIFDKVGANVQVDDWMDPKAIALFIKQILDLPKNIEVSEVVIRRKAVK